MQTMAASNTLGPRPFSQGNLPVILRFVIALSIGLTGGALRAQTYESVIGDAVNMETPTPHWFSLTTWMTAYIIDGDAGTVQGSIPLSMFSPALRPQLAKNRIYFYGAYYSRMYHGDRTDVVLAYDATTLKPVNEVVIPPKSAGIGHSGMIGMVDDRFLGIWNITPAMSVSIVDTERGSFVQELSTPGCAAVYPAGRGFLMPCGDGTLQYVRLAANGTEAGRTRSRSFFSVEEDPVFDYAVPTRDGWLFLSLDGQVFEARVDAAGAITVSDPWSIHGADDGEWRLSGNQPFAYNAERGLLLTLMHEGGGQETWEDPGTEVWAYNVATQRRGYRAELEHPSYGIQVTQDAEPLLLVSPSKDQTLTIHDARSGRKLHELDEFEGGLLQNLLPGSAP